MMTENEIMYACGNVPKRGDLVRLKRGFGMSAEDGAMARVKGILKKDENIYVDIIWLDEKAKNQSYGGYNADYFELVRRWVEEVLIKHQYDIIDKWGKEAIELFRKFYKIVEVTEGVSLRRLAEELDLGDKECRDRAWDWAYILGYKVKDDMVWSLKTHT